MREIKFRAWDGKRMIKIFAHIGKNGRMYTIHHWGEEPKYEVMQYTGLKDKNGKQIYEGDVVLGKFNLDEVEDYIYLTLTEEEKKTQSKLFHIEDIFYPYTNPIPEDLEIIGNVYENPELLSKLNKEEK